MARVAWQHAISRGDACQGRGKHSFIEAAREGGREGDFARASYVTPLNFRRAKSGFMVSIILLIARGWQA
jgi:hypothetical protein